MGTGQRQRVIRDHDGGRRRAASGFARQLDQFDQVIQMIVVNIAWQTIIKNTNRRGLSHDFTHHAACLHHANGTQCFVCDADATTRHEKVVNVSTVETSIGNRIAVHAINSAVVDGDRNERVFGKLLRVLLLRIMQINRPSTRYESVRKVSFGNDVVLRQHDIPHQSPTLPWASDETRPRSRMPFRDPRHRLGFSWR